MDTDCRCRTDRCIWEESMRGSGRCCRPGDKVEFDYKALVAPRTGADLHVCRPAAEDRYLRHEMIELQYLAASCCFGISFDWPPRGLFAPQAAKDQSTPQ